MIKLSIRFFYSILLGFIYAYSRGYALRQMYSWFIEHTFNLPHLSVSNSIGILSLAGLFYIHKSIKMEENSREKMLIELVNGLISPVITLCIGYIVHLFM